MKRRARFDRKIYDSEPTSTDGQRVASGITAQRNTAGAGASHPAAASPRCDANAERSTNWNLSPGARMRHPRSQLSPPATQHI